MMNGLLSTAGRWVRRNVELGTLLVLALAVAGFWPFAELADEVIEGSTRNLDRDLLLLLRTEADLDDPVGPAWIEEVVRDLTAVGGVAVLTLTTLAVAGFFLLQRMLASTLYLLASVGGGLLISSVAKEFFDRPRPDLVPHGSFVHTASFPSGHSIMAAVVYLSLGVLVARTLPQRRLKVYALALAAIATILVGVSRVYLGVHWPTDGRSRRMARGSGLGFSLYGGRSISRPARRRRAGGLRGTAVRHLVLPVDPPSIPATPQGMIRSAIPASSA